VILVTASWRVAALLCSSESRPMKILISCFLYLVAFQAALAQSSPPRQTFHEQFAKAGLRALLAIRGETGTATSSNGGVLVPRRTQELIDDAEVEASTSVELTMVTWLKALFLKRLNDNDFVSRGQTDDFRESMAKVLTIGEAACGDQLEKILRSRVYSRPRACEDKPSQSEKPKQKKMDPKQKEYCKQYEGKPRYSIPIDCLE